jgi:transcriptional regulator with XRE-family HTH domain
MIRSARVRKDYIKKVKAAVQRQGFHRQKDLAEKLKLSLATVNNFLNGKPVDNTNFYEISEALGFDWQEIADTTVLIRLDDEIIDPPPEEPDNFIYIERQPIEEICYKTLSQPGALLRIKAPGWMGKTSLMANMLGKMKHQGYRTVLLDMHYAEINDFSSLEKFLKFVPHSFLHINNPNLGIVFANRKVAESYPNIIVFLFQSTIYLCDYEYSKWLYISSRRWSPRRCKNLCLSSSRYRTLLCSEIWRVLLCFEFSTNW